MALTFDVNRGSFSKDLQGHPSGDRNGHREDLDHANAAQIWQKIKRWMDERINEHERNVCLTPKTHQGVSKHGDEIGRLPERNPVSCSDKDIHC